MCVLFRRCLVNITLYFASYFPIHIILMLCFMKLLCCDLCKDTFIYLFDSMFWVNTEGVVGIPYQNTLFK